LCSFIFKIQFTGVWLVFFTGIANPTVGADPALLKVASGKKDAWTLSTADTEVTVGVDLMDQLVIYKLANPDVQWNWASQPVVIRLPSWLEVRGPASPAKKQRLSAVEAGDLDRATEKRAELVNSATWTFQKTTQASAPHGETVTLTFTCAQMPALALESVWWAASAQLPGPVQHTFRLINESSQEIVLHPIPNLSIALNPPAEHDVTLWTFGDHESTVRKHYVGPQSETSGDGAGQVPVNIAATGGNLKQWMPWVLLDDRGTGGVYLGMEEKMHFSFQIQTRPTTPRFIMRAAYRPENNIAIASRQSVMMRPTYLGVYEGDVDDGSNRFKRWFWNNKTPANHRNDPMAPWLQYGGMWSYGASAAAQKEVWWNDEETYRKGIETEGLADIGIECAEVDAYWDKAEIAGEWPSGTKIMGPLAHANGLKFNLYLMNHITWESRERLATFWEEYQLDMWRNDFQVANLNVQAWAQDNCPKHYRFQFCAASPDFHTMTYASLTDLWEEYNVANLRKQFYTLSYSVPPAQICAMIPIQVASDGDEDRFNLWHRSTLMSGAWIGVGAIGPKYNPRNVVFPSDVPHVIPCMKANLAIYKSKIRPLIREGNLYHDIVDAVSGFDGVQYNSPTADRGVVMLFGPAGKSATVRCKRLQPHQKYRVQFTDLPAQNTTLTGAQLMARGLPVTFNGTTQSEIILIDNLQ